MYQYLPVSIRLPNFLEKWLFAKAMMQRKATMLTIQLFINIKFIESLVMQCK